VELIPGGDVNSPRRKVLGTAEIANDGHGTPSRGNYAFRLIKAGAASKTTWKRGSIEDFPRKVLGGWDLLYRCLREVVAGRNPELDEASPLLDRGAQYWKARAFVAEDRLEEIRTAFVCFMEKQDIDPLMSAIKALVATDHQETEE